MTEKKRTAGYVRVSTSQQVESGTSIDDQLESIYCEALRRGWDEPIFFMDEGISGKSTQRPALLELLEHVKNGKYEIIIYTKLDRLARNLRDTLNIYHQTEECGVAMVCLDNPVISTDGPMGSIMLQIMGAFAQFERDLIRARTGAGRMHKWKNGEAIMGKLPFGYYFDKKSSTVKIDSQKEQIIKRIYQLYLDNRLSMLDIAGQLTDEGVPTPSKLSGRKDASSHWNSNSVREILKNHTYTGGKTKYNQYKYKSNKNNKVIKTKEFKDKAEWVEIEFDKIIDEKLFNQVQARIKHNKAVPKKKHRGYEEKFLADRFLRCGHCKAKISKQTTGARNFIYYACPWRRASEKQLKVKNQRRCHLPFLNSDKVDTEIFNQIVKLITNPKEYAEEWVKDKPTEDINEKININQEKQTVLQGKLKKAIQIEINADKPEIEEIYKREREKIEREYHTVTHRLASLSAELKVHEHKLQSLDQFQKFLQQDNKSNSMRMKLALRKALTSLPFEDKKKLVDAVISPENDGRVYVRELTPTALGIMNGEAENEPPKPTHGNKLGQRDFEIELDFTLEPTRIIDIIQSFDKNVFRLGGQLYVYWGRSSHCYLLLFAPDPYFPGRHCQANQPVKTWANHWKYLFQLQFQYLLFQ